MKKYNIQDKEFKQLEQKLNKLSYIDKIKFMYETYGVIRGTDKRIISKKEYVISLTPSNQIENIERWQFYVEQEALKYCNEWLDKKLKNINKIPNKLIVIKHLHEGIIQEVKSSAGLKRGYTYGLTQEQMDWVNEGSITNDLRPILQEWIKGLGLFYVDCELQKYKYDLSEDPLEDLPRLEQLSNREKLVLFNELGIISHLRSSIWFNLKKRNLLSVLCLLIGIDINSESANKLYDDLKKMDAGDKSKSPINKKNIEKVHKYLNALGLTQKELRELKK